MTRTIYRKMQRTISSILLSLLLVNGATSLKNLKITAPSRVRAGDSVLLTCSYDLEESALYTIKWYLDDYEFYRFVPKKEPPYSTFKVQGIQVNVTNSNTQDVRLDNVQKNQSGRYKCEVTEEEPHYDTQIQEVSVLVIDVPSENPKIIVEKQNSARNDSLRLQCSSGAASTAPNITWTVNEKSLNEKAMQYTLVTNPYDLDQRHGLKYTQSRLNLNTTGLFQDNRLSLRCFAEINLIYRESAKIELSNNGPSVASITSDATPHIYTSGSKKIATMSIWSHGSVIYLVNHLLLLLRATLVR